MYDGRMASELTRITVNLTPSAADDLEYLCASARMSKTNVINRALQAYAWLDRETINGTEVLARSKDGEMTRVTFL